MNVLIINAGSSSIKFQVINPESEKSLIKGMVDGIGLTTCRYEFEYEGEKNETSKEVKNHNEALKEVINTIEERIGLNNISAIGHRVVHGGEFYSSATIIDDSVIENIKDLCELAPLHNPHNLAGILACRDHFPDLIQVAVFDTAFHQTIPKENFMYAIPYDNYKDYKIRRYGFHGTSHKYIAQAASALLNKDSCSIISCHLGNGSSVTCIKDGKSIDTSMGFTPLEGLIMGTRSGDIDPEVVSYLSKKTGKDTDEIIKLLNKESGLKGICGYSDVRTIHDCAEKGDERCKLALDMFSHRLLKYIGAYMAELPTTDAIVFTAGIGQGAYYIREKICESLKFCGVIIDNNKNNEGRWIDKMLDITGEGSKVKVYVIATNEEAMIAKETMDIINRNRL
jgi:acetate kinase